MGRQARRGAQSGGMDTAAHRNIFSGCMPKIHPRPHLENDCSLAEITQTKGSVTGFSHPRVHRFRCGPSGESFARAHTHNTYADALRPWQRRYAVPCAYFPRHAVSKGKRVGMAAVLWGEYFWTDLLGAFPSRYFTHSLPRPLTFSISVLLSQRSSRP